MEVQHINDLPAPVLREVLARVPSDQRRNAVPLVCQLWAKLARDPGAWRSFVFSLRKEQAVDEQRAQAWLRARAPGLEELALVVSDKHSGFEQLVLGTLGQQPRLRTLCLDLGQHAQDNWDIKSKRGDDCLILQALDAVPNSVEVLCLSGVEAPSVPMEPREPLCRLDRLRCLHLHLSADRFRHRGDRLMRFPACLAGCDKLEELVVTEADYVLNAGEGPVRLPRLRRLCLLDCGGRIQPPQGFDTATGLEELRVMGYTRANRPSSLPGLAAFRRLTTVELFCRDFPEALAGLRTLKHLSLWQLWRMDDSGEEVARGTELTDQQQNECFERLLAGVALESLELHSCWLRALPQAVTQQASLRRLTLKYCLVSELPTRPYLQQLQHLCLAFTLFSEIPSTVRVAPQLQTLSMREELVLPPLEARQGPAFAWLVASADQKLAQDWQYVLAKFGNARTDDGAAGGLMATAPDFTARKHLYDWAFTEWRLAGSPTPFKSRDPARAAAAAAQNAAKAARLQPVPLERFVAGTFLPLVHVGQLQSLVGKMESSGLLGLLGLMRA